jgi:hypothetical protein
VLRFQNAVQGVVVQPGLIVLGNEAIAGFLERRLGAFLETAGGQAQEAILDRDQSPVVDLLRRQIFEVGDFLVVQQPLVDEIADINKHLVAGKRR